MHLPPEEVPAAAQSPVPGSAALAGRRVLVTGATGFLGQHLVEVLQRCKASVSALMRNPDRWQGELSGVRGDLTRPESLKGSCSGVSAVFHLAGVAHVDAQHTPETSERHWRVTVEGTRALLEEAVHAGVGRFVFVSSVKAMGEGGDQQLDEASPEAPESAYGKAKLAAERLVRETCDDHGIEWAVLRLPMVYGRDNKGNLPRMVAAIDSGWFLPLPEVNNRRSLVHVDDAVQALLLAASVPQASGQTYIVTDGEVYSTREMVDLIRQALGRPPLRWSLPYGLLRLMGRVGDIGGRLLQRRLPLDSTVCEKLFGSAWYSSDKIARELGYRPSRTLPEALSEIVTEYRLRRVV